ncbi:hypothetical protein BCF74_12939 [Knoellia remsis]|uniref:Uncharacterized protein n=1 Tax=Knoellia remsis TaxID=407159 RepID=A0A2T0U4W1_9MICO|nr:hypothetical protein [Knoellia remsis]PRY52965.1 hypothetical protein BCF74_12939 [Knoellia remsis]
MAGIALNGLLIVALLVAVLSTLAPAMIALRRTELGEEARDARRRSVLASAAAGAAGVGALVLWLWLGPDNQSRSLPALPALVGIAMTVVAIVAERTWPRPSGPVRSAALRMPDRRPGGSARLAVTGAAVSLVVLAIASFTADTIGSGLELTWETGATGHSPYPGPFYAWPILVGGLVLAGLTWWGLREVEARPALGPALEDVDLAVRTSSRTRVLRGATFASLVTGGALLFTFSGSWTMVIRSAKEDGPAMFDGLGWTVLYWCVVAGIIVGFALVLTGIRALVTPGPPMPASAEAPSPDKAGVAS